MPQCTIIVPVHNRWSLTRQCLHSLLATIDPMARGTIGDDRAPEIIVVDDGSTDVTPARLPGYAGRVRVISHASNTGYATACNDGAAAASGEFLVFLNNDALPQPGWLESLVAYAESHPRAAVVGSKLLYPDDTVQHAGVVVCQDRVPRHLYTGFPGDHPAVNKSRRFQIVTAACMLIRREVFAEAGGFDTGYLNGLEDVDLCLRLGERGHEVHYCHQSVLVHLESVTRGRAALERNLERYAARWQSIVRPDDVQYYLDDGLLQFAYGDHYPARLAASPELAVIDADERQDRLEQVLAHRANQVQQLRLENIRLLTESDTPAGRIRPFLARPESPPARPAEATADLYHPDTQRFSGEGDPRQIGRMFLDHLVNRAGLSPGDTVLEVGCGVGRIAISLAAYLSGGRYEGFDIVPEAIEWCQQTLTPRYPSFHFWLADVHSQVYNPGGRRRAAEYQFPYSAATFDVVYLTSVFTHMLPDDVANYLGEIVRVLKPGGRCLITFCLLDPETRALISQGAARLAFNHEFGAYRVVDAAVPEAAVAYDVDYVRGMFEERGLQIQEPIDLGTWRGRGGVVVGQDVVIATKPGRPADEAAARAPARRSATGADDAPQVFARGEVHAPSGAGSGRLISIVLPVKNGAGDLRRFLPRLFSQRRQDELEIVAVDSGSTDESMKILAEHSATILKIDPGTFNHGLTRTLAASHARGSILVFVNQSALPADDDWLANLLRPLDADPGLAAVCSRVVPRLEADRLTARDGLREPSSSPERTVRAMAGRAAFEALTPDQRRLLINFHSVSAAIRAEVFARLPFREVRAIGEDLLWAREALEAGLRILHEPDSVVYHSHNYSLAELFQRNVDDGVANREIVGRRLEESAVLPAILAMARDDWRYLEHDCRLSGPELDRWRTTAVLRRTVQAVGQWVGLNHDRLPDVPIGALSLTERLKAGGPA